MKKIVVLEPGAWGTALGVLLSQRNQVSFGYENPQLCWRLTKTRENERLPEVRLPQNVLISSDFEKLLKDADLLIIASPSFSFRQTIKKLLKFRNLPPLLGLAKGIEKETLAMPAQIVEEVLGKVPYAHLSGPGFAKEVIRGKHAREVIAAKDKVLLTKLKALFQIKPLEISTTADLIGIQLAGAFKNALAIGISLVEADGQKPKISKDLIELGLKEMIALGKAMGAERQTFLGPAGREDLILTSTSPLSRNFQFGKRLLFDAETMRKEIAERKITVEGFETVFALQKLAKHYKIDLPMTREIYQVIYEKISPRQTVKNLIIIANLKPPA